MHHPLTPGTATYSTSASNGGDYGGATSGTVTFAVGATSKTIKIPIWADPNSDANEAFTVTLSGLTGTGVTLVRAVGTGTILGA
jgi:hypothetical protein